MADVLGVLIPESILTKSVKYTDWRIEPLRDMECVNPRWIGNAPGQVTRSMLRLLLECDEMALKKQREFFANKARENIAELETGNYIDFTSRHQLRVAHDARTGAIAKKELLADLRILYLIDCLMCREVC